MMRPAYCAALLLSFGCAATGEPDTAGDVGGAAGAVVSATLRHVPVVNTLIGSADGVRAKAGERLQARRAQREAERVRGMQWQQCAAHPCLHAARCAAEFPREFLAPASCSAGAASGGAAPAQATIDAAGLRAREGLRLTPYPDASGTPHVGYGHRLALDPGEAESLFQADLTAAAAAAQRVVGEPTWSALHPARRGALAEMAFVLGAGGLAGFGKALEAVRAGDWPRAAAEVLDSHWARQAPGRASGVAGRLLTGEAP